MSIPARLRHDLKVAMRSGNKTEVSMIRSLIAAIENAEAVESDLSTEVKVGLGHDQPRRELSEDDITAIMAREKAEVADAVTRYRELGLDAEVVELEERLAIVDRYTTLLP